MLCRDGEEILFYHEGGVDIGDVDSKAARLFVEIDSKLSEVEITEKLLTKVCPVSVFAVMRHFLLCC